MEEVKAKGQMSASKSPTPTVKQVDIEEDMIAYGLQNGILFDRKVKLMPVIRPGGAMIKDPDHIGYFKYNDTDTQFCVPLSLSRGGILPFLNQKEQKFFEFYLKEDLSFTKKENNYWHSNRYRITIRITPKFKQEGLTLDLKDPSDNLKWRVLKINSKIAPSWEERFESGEYQFALMDSDRPDVSKANKAELLKEAYRVLSTIDGSTEKLYNFLVVYWSQNAKAKRPDKDASRQALLGMVQDIIDNDIKGFLDTMSDPLYETKLLINRAIVAQIVIRDGRGDLFSDGRFIGRSVQEAANNLTTPEMQEEFLRITAILGQ